MNKTQLYNKSETKWHLAWKAPIVDEFCNVVDEQYNTDIKTDKYVIEIQKDFISKEEVQEKINYYKQLNLQSIWIINVENAWQGKDIRTIKNKREFGRDKFKLEWKNSWKWVYDIADISNHVYLDFNPTQSKIFKVWLVDGVLFVKWENRLDFYRQYLKDQIQPDYEIKYILRDYFMDLKQ
jgi:hypothetical protein